MFLTIDPGARENGGTGIAFFSKPSNFPISTMQLKGRGETWHNRLDDLLRQYRSVLTKTNDIEHVYIEQPKFFDSHLGHTAARSDNLYKLIVVFARIWEASDNFGIPVTPVAISDWKGQLTKAKISERIQRICGKTWTGDVNDAVGIGLYLKGLL